MDSTNFKNIMFGLCILKGVIFYKIETFATRMTVTNYVQQQSTLFQMGRKNVNIFSKLLPISALSIWFTLFTTIVISSHFERDFLHTNALLNKNALSLNRLKQLGLFWHDFFSLSPSLCLCTLLLLVPNTHTLSISVSLSLSLSLVFLSLLLK